MLDSQIETFLVVAECGSFSSASERLFLSKVSVMKRIDNLEHRLGVTLFERSTQGVKLTLAGRILANGARTVTRQINNLLDEVSHAGTGTSHLKIGTSMLFPSQSLFQYLWKRNINTDSFSFEVTPYETGMKGMSKALSSIGDDIDIVAAFHDPTEKLNNCQVLPLFDEPVHLAMPRSHRLASKNNLQWKDLDDESLILAKRGMLETPDRIRDEIEKNHPHVNIIDVADPFEMSTFNLCSEMKCLMGVMPMWENIHPSLVSRPMDWEYTEKCVIIYSSHPSPATQNFVDFVKSNVNKGEKMGLGNKNRK
ncbi:MAG: LysR family transcriptional regulator [Schwartzia sp.]|nr:LysR family transcriptional regulator [Schwartzia sp. (in: firmicutes)]